MLTINHLNQIKIRIEKQKVPKEKERAAKGH